MTGPAAHHSQSGYDVNVIRRDFPILTRKINGKDLVYLDNAASTQKPESVIQAVDHYYRSDYSNIHRGVHTLSQIGTEGYEDVRKKAQKFVNAKHHHEIIFTKGTTDGINLVAISFSRGLLKKGDEVLITGMEHHSNIVPWQIACEHSGAVLKVIPLQDDGTIRLEDAEKLITEKTKVVSVVYVSNSLGTVNPVREIIKMARNAGAFVHIDAAQAVQHMTIDVQELDCDLLNFSGHKMYGPTGTGFLYGNEDILNQMPPFEGGGDMILDVTFERTTYNDLPFKFEAGTPNIAGAIGMGPAFDYLTSVGLDNIAAHEASLLEYATERIMEVDGVKIYGTGPVKNSVLSFLVEGTHPYDIGVILDNLGIAIRTGHHCTQPIMKKYQIPGTCRASFGMYNTMEEIDYFIQSLKRAVNMLR